MFNSGASTTITTTTTTNKKASPIKLKGPHVQIKCGSDTYMLPFAMEDGTEITGLQLCHKIIQEMQKKNNNNTVKATNLRLIKKGKVIRMTDVLSTSKKYKIKATIQATEEEKNDAKRQSKASQLKEKNDKANGRGEEAVVPKLNFAQSQDLMQMISMGMNPPPGAKEMMTQMLGRPGMEHIMPSTIARSMMNGQPPPQEVMQAMMSSPGGMQQMM